MEQFRTSTQRHPTIDNAHIIGGVTVPNINRYYGEERAMIAEFIRQTRGGIDMNQYEHDSSEVS